jgi:hypothetical protein
MKVYKAIQEVQTLFNNGLPWEIDFKLYKKEGPAPLEQVWELYINTLRKLDVKMNRDIRVEVEDDKVNKLTVDVSKTLKLKKPKKEKIFTIPDLIDDPSWVPADGRCVKLPQDLVTPLKQESEPDLEQLKRVTMDALETAKKNHPEGFPAFELPEHPPLAPAQQACLEKMQDAFKKGPDAPKEKIKFDLTDVGFFADISYTFKVDSDGDAQLNEIIVDFLNTLVKEGYDLSIFGKLTEIRKDYEPFINPAAEYLKICLTFEDFRMDIRAAGFGDPILTVVRDSPSVFASSKNFMIDISYHANLNEWRLITSSQGRCSLTTDGLSKFGALTLDRGWMKCDGAAPVNQIWKYYRDEIEATKERLLDATAKINAHKEGRDITPESEEVPAYSRHQP